MNAKDERTKEERTVDAQVEPPSDRTHALPRPWTRREWVVKHSSALVAASCPALWRRDPTLHRQQRTLAGASQTVVRARLAERLSGPDQRAAMATKAIECARSAGAEYADVRITKDTQQTYGNGDPPFNKETESVGVGVRVLVHGYWGFAASPLWGDADEVTRLARDAVAQAKENAKGPRRVVEVGTYPAATGRWTTPVQIDPFSVTLEEKSDYFKYWWLICDEHNLVIRPETELLFKRQERVVATSEGTCIEQILFQSGGEFWVEKRAADANGSGKKYKLKNLEIRGMGWEHILEANIPEQLESAVERIDARTFSERKHGFKAIPPGRYTLVCDGATMASLVEQTFGLATQLDRALCYEADSSGTSYLDDPLKMVGVLQVAAPMVTVTANRSAPTQLATVRWDDEGVEPEDCTLVKQGVLNDFQTTRESAGWLAPYDAKHQRPVRSHGHAWAETALYIPMQHMPNLALEPGASDVSLEELAHDVQDGLLIVAGEASTDSQARNGWIRDADSMREIKDGVIGKYTGGVVMFNTMDLWRQVTALGGLKSQGMLASSYLVNGERWPMTRTGEKGQPPQAAAHTVRAVAATIGKQPVTHNI